MGQVLSAPMVIAGVILVVLAYRKHASPDGSGRAVTRKAA
jgi:prolipoprotein diacylglyceryltransferase